MNELGRDFRHAVRNLGKDPAFALLAILTLALGIGATTAIFSVVENVLLEPLPYPEPERLVVIQEKNPEAGFPRFSMSPLNFRDYRAMSTSFEAMAARTGTSLALVPEQGGGPARQLRGQQVTADFLRVLDLQPQLGRDFAPEDDAPGAPPVILIGHSLWQELGGTADIVGSDLRIDGRPTTVIGVLPPRMHFETEALVPLAHDYEESNRGAHWLIAYGRLQEGVSVEQARAELESVAARLEEEYPASNTGWSAVVDPLHARVVEDVDTALWVLLAAVGLVLLIACANVANLTLARLARREREMALRSALGAGRGALLRQLLAESLLLALIAGALGVLLAGRATAWLVAMNEDGIPRAETVAIDGEVLVFALVASLGTALIFGLFPALQASRVDLAGTLKEGGRGHAGGVRGRRLRLALVAAETALAVTVLVGAGLLIKSFGKLIAVDPGLDAEAVWTASVSLPDEAYAEEPERIAFYRRLLEETAAIPGVEHAATVMPMPLSGGNWVNTAYLEGEPIPEPNQEHNVNIHFVAPGYFAAMGIPLRRGRVFDAGDHAEATPAVVINERAAEQLWPDREPVGSRISFGRPDAEEVRWYTVIGVVGDVRAEALDRTVQPTFHRVVLQDAPGFATVVLRAAGGDPSSLAEPLRAAMARVDPTLPLFREQTARDFIRNSVAEPRFNSALLGVFAGLALALAAIGVFGVVSYTVAQQLRELGVRLALGAGRRRIIALVLGTGLRPVLLGALVGLLAALALSRLLTSLVYGTSVADPATYLLAGLALLAAAALASLLPALRATHVDPIVVLREE